MYLHIGNGKIVFSRDLIGIFNIAHKGKSKQSKFCNESIEVTDLCLRKERPKSFIVSDHGIFISPIASQTLSKRLE